MGPTRVTAGSGMALAAQHCTRSSDLVIDLKRQIHLGRRQIHRRWPRSTAHAAAGCRRAPCLNRPASPHALRLRGVLGGTWRGPDVGLGEHVHEPAVELPRRRLGRRLPRVALRAPRRTPSRDHLAALTARHCRPPQHAQGNHREQMDGSGGGTEPRMTNSTGSLHRTAERRSTYHPQRYYGRKARQYR
jgi:hypothetical protein